MAASEASRRGNQAALEEEYQGLVKLMRDALAPELQRMCNDLRVQGESAETARGELTALARQLASEQMERAKAAEREIRKASSQTAAMAFELDSFRDTTGELGDKLGSVLETQRQVVNSTDNCFQRLGELPSQLAEAMVQAMTRIKWDDGEA
jgi:paraquat-inducible protein B